MYSWYVLGSERPVCSIKMGEAFFLSDIGPVEAFSLSVHSSVMSLSGHQATTRCVGGQEVGSPSSSCSVHGTYSAVSGKHGIGCVGCLMDKYYVQCEECGYWNDPRRCQSGYCQWPRCVRNVVLATGGG